MEVPDKTDSQVGVVVPVRMVVVDVQPVSVEVADVDAVAIGVEIIAYFRP